MDTTERILLDVYVGGMRYPHIPPAMLLDEVFFFAEVHLDMQQQRFYNIYFYYDVANNGRGMMDNIIKKVQKEFPMWSYKFHKRDICHIYENYRHFCYYTNVRNTYTKGLYYIPIYHLESALRGEKVVFCVADY